VPTSNKGFYRAFSPEPEERSDFANAVDEFLAITNRRLCEHDLTSLCSRYWRAVESRTEGSNPTLSATQSELQRNAAAFNSKLWEIAAILQFHLKTGPAEGALLSIAPRLSSVFLWRAPIGRALLYAEQPIYLQAERSPMPELRLVVLALQDRPAYGPTFESALVSLSGGAAFVDERCPGPRGVGAYALIA
jgi:hypothetical protein